ncbi:hypothetical protein Taro_040196 [Colocasia esculenta]|uniref:Uncharacterized protein n=1 Tax=Colocasia esculenta TaxID=4460 RepID=A0A843WXT4_COLES|nr:hypothetical protein [Colocasia esculenta]
MDELPLFAEAVELFPFAAVDTEFSGFLRHPLASMEQQQGRGHGCRASIYLMHSWAVVASTDGYVGYILRDLRPHIPCEVNWTLTDFALLADEILGSVLDTKYLARLCGEEFHSGDLRLECLIELLHVLALGVHRFPHLLEKELEGFLDVAGDFV